MKKVLASVCGGAALVVLLAGCDPHLAQIESGTQEELWYKQLKSNYSSFTPPPNPAPAAYTPGYSRQVPAGGIAAPADDPDKAVDGVADAPQGKTPAPEELPIADSKDAKADKAQAKGAGKADKADKAAPVAEPEVAGKAKNAEADKGKNEAVDGKLYVVKAGDTLGGIAKKFYGKASMEDVIFRANSKLLKNRNTLSIGMRLVIPEL